MQANENEPKTRHELEEAVLSSVLNAPGSSSMRYGTFTNTADRKAKIYYIVAGVLLLFFIISTMWR